MQFPVTPPSHPPRQVLPVPAKGLRRVGVAFRKVTRLSHHGVLQRIIVATGRSHVGAGCEANTPPLSLSVVVQRSRYRGATIAVALVVYA